MTAIYQDENVIKKGIVALCYLLDTEPRECNMQVMTRGPTLSKTLPVRVCAVHFCYDDLLLRPLMSMLQIALSQPGRLRFRTHFGSHLECQYALMTFGISQHVLPVDSLGNMRNKDFVYHIQQCKLKLIMEAQETEMSTTHHGQIDVPTSRDVVLGRGKPYQDHPGNTRLAGVIDVHRLRFDQLKYGHKGALCEEILQIIKTSNGRFLKRAKQELDGWVQVEDQVAKERISHGFRTNKKKNKKAAAAAAAAVDSSSDK
jgi:hypothetical protein